MMSRGEFIRQLVHHIPVYHRVQILAEHIEKKPITDFAPPNYRFHGFSPDQTKP